MTHTIRQHRDSITVNLPAERLYALVSDVTRTGEWSPVCKSCWWDDEASAGQVGAWFTGRNEVPDRTWETRSQVVAAEPGREFAWVVGGKYVRWGFTLTPSATGTVLTESWEFLPAGITMFGEKYGAEADAQIAERNRQALDGIPKTLAAIKQIAESADGVSAPGPAGGDATGFEAAYQAAQKSLAEGGIPIGAAIARGGVVFASGHNERVQNADPIAHGEMSALRAAGRQKSYRDTTLYTTLAPCAMCAGTIIQFKIPRVVVGEARTFDGELELLRSRGVEVVVLDDQRCVDMMAAFQADKPELWAEDIAE